MKRALITGITGMDGSILADYLLSKNYSIYGLIRRSASPNYWRIKHLIDHPQVHLVDGDITSSDSIHRIIEESKPDLIFNLAAQSFVPYSWSAPVNTFEVNAIGVLNLLEAIRNIDKSIKFYQASSSEMFGKVQETPQTEKTIFYPRSPYGVSKVAAHYATINYFESFGIHATSGILFNHEHERRGEEFVTRKISKGIAHYFLKKMNGQSAEPLMLGNLDAKRDWGYAEDYVKAMYKIIYHATPEPFVIATGITRTVREWCEAAVESAVKYLNLPHEKIEWKGTGSQEKGFFSGEPIFVVSQKFYRPAEVDLLLGSPEKAKKKLAWVPETPFNTMVQRMVHFDIQQLIETERPLTTEKHEIAFR